MVPGFWSMVPGYSRRHDPRTTNQGLGTSLRSLVSGPWSLVTRHTCQPRTTNQRQGPSSRSLVGSSLVPGLDCRATNREQPPGTRNQGLGTKNQGPGTRNQPTMDPRLARGIEQFNAG